MRYFFEFKAPIEYTTVVGFFKHVVHFTFFCTLFLDFDGSVIVSTGLQTFCDSGNALYLDSPALVAGNHVCLLSTSNVASGTKEMIIFI